MSRWRWLARSSQGMTTSIYIWKLFLSLIYICHVNLIRTLKILKPFKRQEIIFFDKQLSWVWASWYAAILIIISWVIITQSADESGVRTCYSWSIRLLELDHHNYYYVSSCQGQKIPTSYPLALSFICLAKLIAFQ